MCAYGPGDSTFFQVVLCKRRGLLSMFSLLVPVCYHALGTDELCTSTVDLPRSLPFGVHYPRYDRHETYMQLCSSLGITA